MERQEFMLVGSNGVVQFCYNRLRNKIIFIIHFFVRFFSHVLCDIRVIIFFVLQLRDSSSSKLKYERVKKLLRGNKSDLFKTGGGPPRIQYTALGELEKELYETIQVSIERLDNRFGGDNCK